VDQLHGVGEIVILECQILKEKSHGTQEQGRQIDDKPNRSSYPMQHLQEGFNNAHWN